MTPQTVDGTGIMIGPEAGLMGVQRELAGRGVHMMLQGQNSPCVCHSRNQPVSSKLLLSCPRGDLAYEGMLSRPK